MTTENYVSFETAKLLKEKGFDGECKMKYREHDKKMLNHIPRPGELNYTVNAEALRKHSEENHCEYCLCPTLQMALRWLCEEKHFYVQIMLDSWALGGHSGYYIVIQDTISDFEDISPCVNDKDDVFFKTYEEAADAALKYCVEKYI